MNTIKYIIAFAALAFAIACSQTATTPNTASNAGNANKTGNAVPTNVGPANVGPVADAMSGKDLYAKNCMICHKENGTGGKVTIEGKTIDADDLTTAKMKTRTDEKLFNQVSEGAPDDGMPAFKGKLNDDQIKAVVKHMRELQGS